MKRRGLTLSELLVGMGLMSLVMVTLSNMLRPSLQIWEVNRARADADQAALVLIPRVLKEMSASARESFTYSSTSPVALSFLATGAGEPPYDTRSGKPLWRHFVIYSLDESNRILYRREWSGAPFVFPLDRAQPLTLDQLRTIAGTPSPQNRRASYHVSSLTLTDTPGQPLALELEFLRPVRGRPQTTLRSIEVRPRH